MDVQKDRQILKGYMQLLFEEIIMEAYENPSASNGSGLEIKVKQLSEQLKTYKRKAVYQYLPKSCKTKTDDVMEEFLKEKHAHEFYTAMCAQENEQGNKNSPDSPEMLVKNEILQYAQRLSKQTLLQEKAAALGIEGHLSWMAEDETDRLLKKAFEIEYPEFAAYLSKAEQGDTEAQYRVGHLYLNGFSGMERDYREGMRWLRTAAKGGNPRAMFELGKMKLKSNDSIERMLGREQLQFAFRGLTNETEFETDTYAKRALGEFYEKGLIFEADPETAAYWYRRAEEQESGNNNSYSDIWLDEEEELEQWYLRTAQESAKNRRQIQEKNSGDTDKAEEMNWNGFRFAVLSETDAKTNAPMWTVRLKEKISRDEFAKLCREAGKLGGSYSKERRCFLFRENPAELFQSAGTHPAHAMNLLKNQRDNKEKISDSNKKTAVRKEFQEGALYYHGIFLRVIPVKGVQEDNSAVWMVTPKKKLESEQFEKLAEQMNGFGKSCFKFHGGFLFRSGNPAVLLQQRGGYILKDVKLDKNPEKEVQQSRKAIRGTAVPYHNLRQPK